MTMFVQLTGSVSGALHYAVLYGCRNTLSHSYQIYQASQNPGHITQANRYCRVQALRTW